MAKKNFTCISKIFTLDPLGQICDLHFMIVVYYIERKTLMQIGDIFGCGEDFAKGRLDRAYKELGAHTFDNVAHLCWKNKHFNDTNTADDAEWRNNRYYYEGRKFHLKK